VQQQLQQDLVHVREVLHELRSGRGVRL